MRFVGLCMAGAVVSIPFAGCRQERKIDMASSLKPEGMPTMKTRNVSTLISDSGNPKYKIVAPVWYVYDEVDTPYWSFPEGLYLQQVDRNLHQVASVACDSARYLSRRQLWCLYGNVEMRKKPKDLFLSHRLFWDQKAHMIYSDTFMHIETATHVLEGTGFESNESMTSYRVLKPTGIFPVDRSEFSGPAPRSAPGTPPGTLPTAAVPMTSPPSPSPRTPVAP